LRGGWTGGATQQNNGRKQVYGLDAVDLKQMPMVRCDRPDD
jgi:hypothetical protein